MSKYTYYEGYDWDRHWAIPFVLGLKYPDLIHLEMVSILYEYELCKDYVSQWIDCRIEYRHYLMVIKLLKQLNIYHVVF